MTSSGEKAIISGEKAIERGEYVVGIALILASLLLSSTLYFGLSGLADAVSKVQIAAPAAQQPTAPTQPTQPTQPTVPTVPTQPTQPAPGQPINLPALDFSSAYKTGAANGKVVMVEYSDFECPFCGMVAPTIAQVKQNYPDTTIIFRHFPLSFHPSAQKAAEASECAGVQGKFWEMHDAMFADQGKITVPDLKATAVRLGLDATAFATCLDSGQMASKASTQQQEGAVIGITGTPGFLIYSRDAGNDEAKLNAAAAQVQGQVVRVSGAGSGIVFAGALPYAQFQAVLNAFN